MQPRSFWALTRRKLKTKTGVASLLLSNKNDENSIKHQDKEKANILQRQFCSVFTDEPSDSIPPFPARTDKSIIDVEVTHDMVKDYLGKLNANKSCGPDDLHPRILKEVKDTISELISLLMNMSIEQGTIPSDWKNAMITPIYKKES